LVNIKINKVKHVPITVTLLKFEILSVEIIKRKTLYGPEFLYCAHIVLLL